MRHVYGGGQIPHCNALHAPLRVQRVRRHHRGVVKGVSDVPWSVLNDSQGVFLSVDAGVWSLSLARLLLLAFKPSLLPLLPPLRPTDKRVEEANGSNPRAV